MEIVALLCLVIAVILLVVLTVIDFKTFLLPNIYVAPFALLGVAFHLITDFYYLSPSALLIGGVAAYGILYAIRYLGSKYYGEEALGLGDVKLLGASGLWLGLDGVLFAMTIGAAAGLIHGLIQAYYNKIKTKKPFSIKRLTIPAGPGFVVGILVMGGIMYKPFVIQSLYDLFF